MSKPKRFRTIVLEVKRLPRQTKDSAFAICPPFIVSCMALDAGSLDARMTFVSAVLAIIPKASVVDTSLFVFVWMQCL